MRSYMYIHNWYMYGHIKILHTTITLIKVLSMHEQALLAKWFLQNMTERLQVKNTSKTYRMFFIKH